MNNIDNYKISIRYPKSLPINIYVDNKKLQEYIQIFFPYSTFLDESFSEYLEIFVFKHLDGYKIAWNDNNLYVPKHYQIPRKIQDIIAKECYCFSPFIPLHSAVLMKDNVAFCFIGATHAGKSTLATYLAHKGFNYYTDDLLIVSSDFNSLQSLIPVYKPIHLRLDSYTLLKENYNLDFNAELINWDKEKRWSINLTNEKKQKIKKIVFIYLNRSCDGKNEAYSIKNDFEKFQILSQNLYFVGHIEDTIKQIRDMAKKVSMYKLTYNDLNSVINIIISLI